MNDSAAPDEKPSVTGDAETDAPKVGEYYCVLTRITDDEYIKLGRRSYPITEQYGYKHWRYRNPEKNLSLAQFYTGMRCLFGRPGYMYDDWKGSFSFVFSLKVSREGKNHPYLLNVTHYRSGIDFIFRRIVDEADVHDLDLSFYRAPLEDELPGDDMEGIESYLHAYARGFLEGVKDVGMLRVPDFLLVSESNLILSGRVDGAFFQRQMETHEAFEADREALRHLSGNSAEWPSDTRKPTTLTIKLG